MAIYKIYSKSFIFKSCTADYLLTTYAQYQLINSKKTLFAKTLSYALFESSTRTEVTQCKNVI